VTTSAAFKRTFDSIPSIFALTEDAFAREGIDTRLLHAVDLALEELFTNMVKYSTTTNGAVQVTGRGHHVTDRTASPWGAWPTFDPPPNGFDRI